MDESDFYPEPQGTGSPGGYETRPVKDREQYETREVFDDPEEKIPETCVKTRRVTRTLTLFGGIQFVLIAMIGLLVFSFVVYADSSAVPAPPINGLPAKAIPSRDLTALTRIGITVIFLSLALVISLFIPCWTLVTRPGKDLGIVAQNRDDLYREVELE